MRKRATGRTVRKRTLTWLNLVLFPRPLLAVIVISRPHLLLLQVLFYSMSNAKIPPTIEDSSTSFFLLLLNTLLSLGRQQDIVSVSQGTSQSSVIQGSSSQQWAWKLSSGGNEI